MFSFVDVFCTFGLDYNTIDEVILSKKYSILFLSKEILAYPKQLKVWNLHVLLEVYPIKHKQLNGVCTKPFFYLSQTHGNDDTSRTVTDWTPLLDF